MGDYSDPQRLATEAIDVSLNLRKVIYDNGNGECRGLVGAVADPDSGRVRFFVSASGDLNSVDAVSEVVYEDQPEKYVWERGCLLRCQLPIKLPLYYPVNRPNGEILNIYFS